MENPTESINIQEDPRYKEGFEAYKSIELKANSTAEKISEKLIESIVRKEDAFNISMALMATGKTLTHLASYLYDTEEEFLADVQKARKSVVTDVIPALLDPRPCGKCINCKNGKYEECMNPEIRDTYTTTRFLPVLCNMLIEYDLFNKILHMYVTANTADNTGNTNDSGSPDTGTDAGNADV